MGKASRQPLALIGHEEWFKRLDAVAAKYNAEHPKTGNDVSDIFGAVGVMSAMAQEAGRMKAHNRKARRQMRYKFLKEHNLLKKRPTKAEKDAKRTTELAEIREGEQRASLEIRTSCTCFLGYPPCPWCTREIGEEEDHG